MPKYAGEVFDLPNEAVALGQRIGRKCEEIGVSIGSASHLYLCFTPGLPNGELRLTEYAVEPWHRFILSGLDQSFNRLTVSERTRTVCDATFEAIGALAEAGAQLLPQLRTDVSTQGEALRVTIRTKETRRYHIAVEQTVPVHPNPSHIIARIESRVTSKRLEVRVAEVPFHDDGPSLVDRIAVVDEVLVIYPRRSFRASLITREHELPLRVNLREHFGV